MLMMMKIEKICRRKGIKIRVKLSETKSLIRFRGVRLVLFRSVEQVRYRDMPFQVERSLGLDDRERIDAFLLVDSDSKPGKRFPKASLVIEMIKQSRGLAFKRKI